jgi:hypothetical protein
MGIGGKEKPISPETEPAQDGPVKCQLLRILREAVVIHWLRAATPSICS